MLVSIGIPAYNEEKNIGKLLGSLLNLECETQLHEIIVISEGSQDSTENIAQIYSNLNPKVKVYGGKTRKGKPYAINKILNLSRGDVIILLDADVQIRSNFIKHFERYFSGEGKFDLVSGVTQPAMPSKFNPIQRAMVFTANLRLHFLECNPYYAFRTIIAIRKEVAKKITIPKWIIGDDAYLYFLGIKNKWKLAVCKNAKVINKEPATLRDATLQWIRYKRGLNQLINLFGERLIRKETAIPMKKIIKVLINELIKHPLDVLIWFLVRILIRIYSMLITSKTGVFWEIAYSTK